MTIKPELISGSDVRLDIETNIPGIIEVMVGLSLRNQAADDVWIGKNERLRLSDGTGSVTLSTAELPAGDFVAEVDFYPRWGFQDATSRASGISDRLSASTVLSLAGSGESAQDAQFKENAQKWVMLNVSMGDPWAPEDWIRKYGKYQELPVSRGNPEILKAYYFPKIDVTLIVNTLKHEITIWRLGKQSS